METSATGQSRLWYDKSLETQQLILPKSGLVSIKDIGRYMSHVDWLGGLRSITKGKEGRDSIVQRPEDTW